jgi:rfaE bifunctional protein kinase chain/domain
MTPARLDFLHSRYSSLKIAVLGDFCLDRYLEIDPVLTETSIETGLPVHNVTRIRPQAGAAGTVLNNLAALGVGSLVPIGFHGRDGEGFELRAEIASLPGVDPRFLLETTERRTFTYTKPLLVHPTDPPKELSRLDFKNWSPTPESVSNFLGSALKTVFPDCDAVIVMDQVDRSGTGVVTDSVLDSLRLLRSAHPDIPVFADSRSGLQRFPNCRFKLNAAELAALLNLPDPAPTQCATAAQKLAQKIGQQVYVSLSEHGILCAHPNATNPVFVPALPVRGPIDVVGAGDCVTANLAAAIGAGAQTVEALQMAMLACSHVVHQLGTSGSASCSDQKHLLSKFPFQTVPHP